MHVRAVDTAERTVTGIAVPWDSPTEINDWFGSYTEQFARGSVQNSDDALLYWRHSEPIGRIVSHRDTDAGWEITARISETPRGDEAYTLLRDGVVRSMSVGFRPITTEVDDETGNVTRTAVEVPEVSLVPMPAYTGAAVTDVRHRPAADPHLGEPAMPENVLTRADLDAALTLDRSESDRRFDALAAQIENSAGPAALPHFRSMGEYLKAVATGDESALTLHRAYTGAGLADAVNRNVWLADAIKLVEKRRKVMSTFQVETLPAEGMTLEYAKLKSDSTKVGKQAKEGDNLVTGKIALTTATASVDTYGGYVELSRQVIERGSAAYLSTAFCAMGMKYANETEAAVRAELAKTNTARAAADDVLTLGAAFTTYDLLDLLVDSVERYEDLGFNLEGGYLSKDVFKRLLRLEDTNGNMLMRVQGEGVNQVGTIDVKGLEGAVAGVSFKLLPGAAANTIAFYDPTAITTFESAGAPYQLQDENILNLTKDFSVYGYLATAVQFPEAIQPVKIAAA